MWACWCVQPTRLKWLYTSRIYVLLDCQRQVLNYYLFQLNENAPKTFLGCHTDRPSVKKIVKIMIAVSRKTVEIRPVDEILKRLHQNNEFWWAISQRIEWHSGGFMNGLKKKILKQNWLGPIDEGSDQDKAEVACRMSFQWTRCGISEAIPFIDNSCGWFILLS